MKIINIKDRIFSAHTLLTEETTTYEKFNHLRTLIRGVNPKIDKHLDSCAKLKADIEKLQKGQVIELTAENLSEQTEEEKKRKRAILAFISNWKLLKGEVERVKAELSEKGESKLDQPSQVNNKINSFAKIAKFAKGPFGIITVVAVVAVFAFGLFSSQKDERPQEATQVEITTKQKIQVILFNNKKIPLSEVRQVTGHECSQEAHYHARTNNTATAIDGTKVPDPNPFECGYGKVKEVKVEEVEAQ